VESLDLDVLWFVPNASQPLKGAGQGSPLQRLEMVRLLTGDDGRFGVDSIEVDRAGISYTVDTLAEYANRFPAAKRYLLVGADVVGTFPQWRQTDRIRELAEVVVLERAPGRADEQPSAWTADTDALPGARHLTTRRVDVSSTEIRERVRHGRSIRGFVPDAVAAYIAAARLYQ
jgi:nicotinate-nucleotide adenylyltransferase